MALTRRKLLLTAGAMPLASYGLAQAGPADTAPAPSPARAPLPHKGAFNTAGSTYLNAGSQHPLSLGAQAEAQRYLAKRALDPAAAAFSRNAKGALEKYAKLVNADPDEIAFVQSTTTGEQMILRSLGFPQPGRHIVSDTLHFFGSLPLYEEMAKQGMKVTWVRDRDGRIPLEDMKKAITPGTRLVALSLVSTINGFQHDLKAVCDIAHEAGALVYADIIHAVGCVPVDLHASGVDFAAGASYKWLMGEFGLGFVYARRESQSQLQRTNYGYYGMNSFRSHIYPFDPPGERIVDYGFRDDATGLFALGTHAHTPLAILNHSLDYILDTGVDNIQAHAQSLVAPLREELTARGFAPMTPPDATTPFAAFALENAREKLSKKLNDARVKISVSRNHFRVTPSVYNDQGDIDRLLEVLGTPS